MITKVTLQNYRCFDDFTLELGKFNAIVGQNDSGKTAFLRAIYNGSTSVELFEKTASFEGTSSARTNSLPCRIAIVAGNVYVLNYDKQVRRFSLSDHALIDKFKADVCPISYFQFDPVALKQNSRILNSPPFSSTGDGFPTFLEDLLREDRQTFFDIEQAFYQVFPWYKKINISKDKEFNILTFETQTGQKLLASEVSDGTILYLAFLAICMRANSPKTILVEEPENGVHHSRLKQIVDALKALSENQGVQVILTSHSPYLLDLIAPEDVIVFAKDDKSGAVKAGRLSEVPDIDVMKKDFGSGEIWTSFDEKSVAERAGGK